MEAEIAWYIGALLTSWSLGWCGGSMHKWLQQLAEKSTSG